MPAATKTRKKRASISADPKRRRIRPFSALICILFGLLLLVSLVFYHPSQNPRHTTDPEPNEVVGLVGVRVADVQLNLFGLAAWTIPLIFFWLGYLFLFRRGYLVNSSRCSTAIMTLMALAGIMELIGTRIWTRFPSAFPGEHDYFQAFGMGGYFGQLLYSDTMEPLFGAWTGGAILLLLFAVCGTLAFTNRIQDFFLTLGDRLENWKAARHRRKEERIARKRKAKVDRQKEKERLRREKSEARKRARLEKRNKPKVAPKQSSEEPTNDDKPDLLAGVSARSKSTERQPAKPEPQPEPRIEPKPEPAPKAETKPAPKPERRQPPPDLKIVAGEKTEKATDVIPVSSGDYTFPTLDLLQEPSSLSAESEQDHYEIAETLKETLAQFKIEVELGEIHTGPVITRYEVTPAAGVRVEKIASLDKNLAMNLRAEAVRILAPVPGRGVVGVEVPNQKPQSVCLRDIIETRDWVNSKSEIPIVLGKEVSGKPIIADLTKMPHLLIAGATGAGKTVCINAIIASLLYSKTPADLRFIMVDPKIVEMQAYNVLPHMLIPVVTEPKKVPAALKWLLREMERRYQLFATIGVRNIAGFNAKILKNKEEAERAAAMDAELTPEERAEAARAQAEMQPDLDLEIPKEKIPYIVCIVDELADLMMVAPADIENCIARLAQLARAAGIHLVIATQRPSADVITGIIKANLPTRIAFKVASNTDSRVILDSKGAEALIGRGDMLFTPPGSTSMIRAQGAFVSDEEIAAIVSHIETHNDPVQYAKSVQEHIENADQESGGSGSSSDEEAEGDEALVQEAIQVLRATQRASTSMLQRRLRIGYNRAARVMEMLEDRGIVGPENGSSPRDILVDLESL